MHDPITSGAPGGAPAFSSPRDQAQQSNIPPAFDDDHKPAADKDVQTASSLASQAKQKLTGALDSQKGAAADFVEQLAQSVQRSGEQFVGRQDWIASAVSRGAAELNALAGSLRKKDLSELANEVQSFAKRKPAMFMGVALVAGFAVARVGKVIAGDLSRDDLPTVPEVGHDEH